MHVYEHLSDIRGNRQSVITIGNFDGVHLGHQQLIHEVVQSARNSNHNAILVTFWPHPRTLIQRSEPACLTPLPEKLRQVEKLGVDAIVILPFNRDLMQMRAQAFMEMLHEHLRFGDMWEGPDFAVGCNREGDQTFLKIIGKELGFCYHTCNSIWIDGLRVSSTRIRQALEVGDLAQVNACLARPFQFQGEVVEDCRDLYQPGKRTVKIRIPINQAIPQSGEYLGQISIDESIIPARAWIDPSKVDGRQAGIANLAVTGWHPDLAHRSVRVELIDIAPSRCNLFAMELITSQNSDNYHAFNRQEY